MSAPLHDVIALFPLGHVLMPGCMLPMRIFEPRYREMLSDVTNEDGRGAFGIVALTAGSEVATTLDTASPRFADVGTIAEILEVTPASDGTFSVLTGGSSRFRMHRLVETDTAYLKAEVSYLKEVDGDLPPGLIDATRALSDEYARLVSALSRADPPERAPYPSDASLLSYRLATEAPLSQDEHQQLLEDETTTARLKHLQRALRRELILLRRTRSIAVSPGLLRIALRPN